MLGQRNRFSGGNRKLSLGTRGGHHYPEGIILEWFSQGWGVGSTAPPGLAFPTCKMGIIE